MLVRSAVHILRGVNVSESNIEELDVPKKGLSDTVLSVYALMRGSSGGDLGPLYETVDHHLQPSSEGSDGRQLAMPDRQFLQNTLPHQMTTIFPTPAPSKIEEAESGTYNHLGLIHVNGRWIDPEDLETMGRALNADPDVINPPLPGIDSFSGPYVLSKSEQSLVYAEFLDDEDDSEDDPRTFRISPETFAKWARGAIKEEKPQQEAIKQPIQVRSGPLLSKERTRLTVLTPQYCADTGDCLSPAYSVDEEPTPLLSPQSVNMNHLPMMFSRSYPLHALQFKRYHYFDAHVAKDVPAPSGPECITSECVREALAVDGDPESGTRQVNEIKDYVNQLRGDCLAIKKQMSVFGKIRHDLEKEVDQLRTGTHLLRKRAAYMAESARKASQRRRIKEHLGNYIEMLTHKRARMEFNAQKLYKKNEDLLMERDKYKAELLNLQDTITALREAEELEPHYETTDDEEQI